MVMVSLDMVMDMDMVLMVMDMDMVVNCWCHSRRWANNHGMRWDGRNLNSGGNRQGARL